MQNDHSPLACPVCRANLKAQKTCYKCPAGHSFDIARQGYLNLLLSHHKRSKQPGDSKEMVDARQQFLTEGHYLPIYQELEKLVLKYGITPSADQAYYMVDLGCGEGYYTRLLSEKLRASLPAKHNKLHAWGIDISKAAIISACRGPSQVPPSQVRWLIANLTHSPFIGGQMNLVTALFCRISEEEIVRLLKNGGIFIFVKPGPKHLIQLRELIYSGHKKTSQTQTLDVIQEKKTDHHPALELLEHTKLNQPLKLDSAESIQALFKMTPHYWRTPAAQKEKLLLLDQLQTEISVELFCFRKVRSDEPTTTLSEQFKSLKEP